MKFDIKTGELTKQKGCYVVGIYDKGELSTSASKLDKLSHGHIKQVIKDSQFEGKSCQTLIVYHVPHLTGQAVLLVGLGSKKAMNASDYRKLLSTSTKAVLESKSAEAIFFFDEINVEKHHSGWKTKQAVEVITDSTYRFAQFKSEKQPEHKLKHVTLHIESKTDMTASEKGLKQALAITSGVEYTKNLANMPSNICNPAYLANEAKKLAKAYKNITVKVLERKDMQKLGMGAFLAVAQGSVQAPKLICIEYKGSSKKTKTVALVGKGITFDTGGVSLKPADAMVGMKYDMCGAATVLGTMKAVAEAKLPIHVVGLLAAAENMPSGTACKPEDIVTTMSGQTVEIMNTDAEGRLVLCDTLTYCERYKPDVVIDIATLTGAVVIALGHHATGMLSNHEPLAQDLLAAGIESHDRAWQMPLWEEYQEQLKSPFADMSNVGGRSAGTITAACFLARFTKKYHWAHLDVAGTAAMMGGNDRYATGRPVPMLMQYLINQAK